MSTPDAVYTPLVLAAHGTRNPAGVEACRHLAELVGERLPGVPVHMGFVELTEPPISEAVRAALAARTMSDEADGPQPAAPAESSEPAERIDPPELSEPTGRLAPGALAVVPLMLGSGGHVQDDIPNDVAEGLTAPRVPCGAEVTVGYARPLGGDPRLLNLLQERLHEAAGQWRLRDVAVVLLGRGSAIAEANADHARLARMLYEQAGVAAVHPGYLQVTRPSLPEALSLAVATGARQLVVVPNLLFPGLLTGWMDEQIAAWSERHVEIEVRIAGILGACADLADIVVDRYHEAVAEAGGDAPAVTGAPAYLTGLRLQGADVLVVGAGHVADRRVPRLLAAGATVRLVSPTISVRLRTLAAREKRLIWTARPFADGDVGAAWFVMASTNDPAVNARVAAEAQAKHTFCVRADAAALGTAWTPAVQDRAGLSVAVLGDRDPRRSVAVRDALVRALLS